MTVIAAKEGVMAADTMLSAGNAQNRAQKLVRMTDGGVAGGCGVWRKAYVGLQFLAAGGDPNGKDGPDIDGATLLIARPDGSLWMVEDEFPAFPLMDAVAAIGCGADAAKMAMEMGLSAVEAVAKVTKQDVLCGDPVQSMDVFESVTYPGAETYVAPANQVPRGRRKRAR